MEGGKGELEDREDRGGWGKKEKEEGCFYLSKKKNPPPPACDCQKEGGKVFLATFQAYSIVAGELGEGGGKGE